MDNFEFLETIPQVFVEEYLRRDEFCLGENVQFWDGEDLDLSNYEIAIVGLKEVVNQNEFDVYFEFRKHLYQLYPGNWHKRIIDLGNIPLAENYKDSEFLIVSILKQLLKKNVIPIILGSSQKYSFCQYRAYDEVKYMVNLACVDAKFDLGNADSELSNTNYVGHMVVQQPYNLFNYANLGYQNFYVRQDEVSLLDKLHFESYRLGEITTNIRLVEPILRDTDLVSIDMESLKVSEIGIGGTMVNGFLAKELAAIARYAGLSEKVSSISLYLNDSKLNVSLNEVIAQTIWYFIEGVNFRVKENVTSKNQNFTKYIVPIENEDLIFYHSAFSDRWWIEIPQIIRNSNNFKETSLLPCTKDNYLNACQQEFPNRWIKAKLKNEI